MFRGIGQGDSLSCLLYIMIMDEFFKNKLDDCEVLIYADDIIIITKNTEDLRKEIEILNQIINEKTMKCNFKK